MKHIFDHPELGKEMIFKGGTTLSKVYGVIERFSELKQKLEQDFDLIISRSIWELTIQEYHRPIDKQLPPTTLAT